MTESDGPGQAGTAVAAALARAEPIALADPLRDAAVLVLCGRTATPSTVAFLVRHTSGFISAALSWQTMRRLTIPMMSPIHELGRSGDLCGVSVDATGTGTGISATSRAMTLRRLADPEAGPADFTKPGHVITVLAARSSGHSEVLHPGPSAPELADTAIDLVRHAGGEPVAAYAHLVSTRDPAGLADLAETTEFARCTGLMMHTVAGCLADPGRPEKTRYPAGSVSRS
ncbi:3,4-dihydroxy-2-butanone-4-phosphate synthase [Sciscionella marina]|uniref:3,4-dihydroxy-2-butanone-4-phosphate synthase n=1 Tax=Sciscionella marina TaxID=508770 RepID=UPI0012F6B74B|nr:3,4-dihydroxy-2-butanone-4-phosphate synthase [Sciscionella marina]